MKNLLLLLFCSQAFAAKTNLITIELGEEYIHKKQISKIWIENPKIISANSLQNKLAIKGLSLGQTQARFDSEIQKIIVVPAGSFRTFSDWTFISKKFLNLKVDICDDVICLKGKIYRFQDFEKILRLMEEYSSSIYFAVEMSDQLKLQVQQYIEKNLRDLGLTPMKLVFSEPWKMPNTNKELMTDYKNKLKKIGILVIENKQKIDITDNIKISVQVTEVKKEFGRTIGIKWPGQYSAQIVDRENINQLPIDVSMLANENEGNVKILASPTLLCRSGKEAEFFAGGEFPIRILNFKINDVVWKKYGIGMKIKPIVDAFGQMSIQIESEVSSLDKSASVDGIPGLQTHKVSSFFDLIKDQTVALSGLLKTETGDSQEGLPFLKNIPILGLLFSSKDYRESKTELVIFVTPQLMK